MRAPPSVQTMRQRAALRYATTKRDGDREVQAERASSSSTPTLQYWLEERGGWFLLLTISLALLSFASYMD